MGNPVRLSDPASKSPPMLRRLIRAGRSEVPDRDRLHGIAARLGFATHGGAGVGLGVATGKKLAGVIVVLLAAGGGGVLATRGSMGPTVVMAPGAAPSTTDVVLVPPPAPARSTSDVADAPLPPISAPRPRPRPATSRTPSSPAASSVQSASAEPLFAAPQEPPLTTERGLVERARRALADDPARALDLANLADDTYPSGSLVQEREVVAIEALVHLGRIDEARARGEHFLRRFPGSVHERHVEALLGVDMGIHEP
jgi:hypothetical protein